VEEYEHGAAAWTSRVVDELAGLIHPLIASIQRVKVDDVPGSEPDDIADAGLKSPLYRGVAIKHEWTATLDETLEHDVESFLVHLYELADSFGSQMTQGLLELVSDTATDFGNVVDGEGQDFFDTLIEATEGLEFTFDEYGHHNTQLVMHPDTAEKLRGRTPTAEQQARLDEIMQRKREEWNAARRRRDLP
jgi:hypothetical protein